MQALGWNLRAFGGEGAAGLWVNDTIHSDVKFFSVSDFLLRVAVCLQSVGFFTHFSPIFSLLFVGSLCPSVSGLTSNAPWWP